MFRLNILKTLTIQSVPWVQQNGITNTIASIISSRLCTYTGPSCNLPPKACPKPEKSKCKSDDKKDKGAAAPTAAKDQKPKVDNTVRNCKPVKASKSVKSDVAVKFKCDLLSKKKTGAAAGKGKCKDGKKKKGKKRTKIKKTKGVEGKVAIITGGCGGIGLAMARVLLKNGAKGVAIADRSMIRGKKIVGKLYNEFGKNKAIFMRTNVGKKVDLDKAFCCTESFFKRIDVVVNNAAIMDEVNWIGMIRVNCLHVVYSTLLGFKYMRNNREGKDNKSKKKCAGKSGGKAQGKRIGGTVINIGAVAAFQPFFYSPIYSATKHFVVGFTRNMGHDHFYKDTKVKVVALCPGLTQTPLVNIRKCQGLNDFRPTNRYFKERYRNSTVQSTNQVASTLLRVLAGVPNGSVWIAEDCKMYQIKFPSREAMRADKCKPKKKKKKKCRKRRKRSKGSRKKRKSKRRRKRRSRKRSGRKRSKGKRRRRKCKKTGRGDGDATTEKNEGGSGKERKYGGMRKKNLCTITICKPRVRPLLLKKHKKSKKSRKSRGRSKKCERKSKKSRKCRSRKRSKRSRDSEDCKKSRKKSRKSRKSKKCGDSIKSRKSKSETCSEAISSDDCEKSKKSRKKSKDSKICHDSRSEKSKHSEECGD